MTRLLRRLPALRATAGLALLLATGGAAAAPSGTLPFGVYDPTGDFANDPAVSIEHVFLPWEDVSLESLVIADNYALERNRVLLISVEPWTWSRDERNTPDFLRQAVLTGYYDANMRAVCQVIDTLQSPVTIRWGHEMDLDGHFIWSGWHPQDYIAAFRRMVDVCRQVAPRVNVMWSPLGLENMQAYYPGDDYVDLVGLTILGWEAYEVDVYGRPLSYNDVLNERYARAAVFGKPVVISELGYTGTQAYVDAWDAQVRAAQPDKPLLVGVVYFNSHEITTWVDQYGQPFGLCDELPDWRIEHRVVEEGCAPLPFVELPTSPPVVLEEVFEK